MACPVDTAQSVAFRFADLNQIITQLNQTPTACQQFIVWMALNKTHSIPGLLAETAFKIFTKGETSFGWPLNRPGRWTPYAGALVISRLIDYKLFLLQLVSQLPRPQTALGFWGASFSVLHLVADPIDTLSGYLTTLVECRRVLGETRVLLSHQRHQAAPQNNHVRPPSCAFLRGVRHIWGWFGRSDPVNETDRQSKVISLVYIAYKHNGHKKSLQDLIHCEAAHPRAFAAAAAALSRDRSSNFSPVATAIFGMCLSVVFKYVFLDRNDVDEVSPQHIDIWSLSSSLVMVHIVPNVLLASVVGVQQSAYTAQGILQALEDRVAAERAGEDERLVGEKIKEWQGGLEGEAREDVIREIVGFNREEFLRKKNPPLEPVEWQERMKTAWHPESKLDNLATKAEKLRDVKRQKHAIKNAQVTNAAISSFRPACLGPPEFKKGQHLHNIGAFLKSYWVCMLAFVIVSVPAIGGTILAAKVPPEGMNCRAFIKLLMVGTYWFKFLAQIGVNHWLPDNVVEMLSEGLEHEPSGSTRWRSSRALSSR